MKYALEKTSNKSVQVFKLDASGAIPFMATPVAVFSGDDAGAAAFAMFQNGLASMQGAELHDANTGQYLIGSLDKISGGAFPINGEFVAS